MSDKILHVLFKVPKKIEEGIRNGSLIRNNDGIVRVAAGEKGGGQIVAHLKEINSNWSSGIKDSTFSNSLSMNMIMMQVCMIGQQAQIKKVLKFIQQDTKDILLDLKYVISKLETIENINIAQLFTPYFSALESLARYLSSNEKQYLIQCEKYLIEATGAMNSFVNLINMNQSVSYLSILRNFAIAEKKIIYIESFVNNELGHNDDHLQEIFYRKEQNFKLIEDKLAQIKRPTQQFPTLSQIRYDGNYYKDALEVLGEIKIVSKRFEMFNLWKDKDGNNILKLISKKKKEIKKYGQICIIYSPYELVV